MSSCVVRVAGPDDLLAVLGVHARRDAGGVPPADASDGERRAWSRMMRTPDLTVYCASVDDEVVGTATLLKMPNVTYDCAPSVFIEAVVVAAEHRRHGVATAMLRRALDDAAAAGCDKVQLLSHKRHVDDGAHDLYRSLGFAPEAEGFRLYLRR
jgi:GNAT superfamily N-acetyltransferase